MKYVFNKKIDGPLYTTEEDEIKLNYRCSKEEQQGEGPGSCGGNKGNKQDTGNSSSISEQSGRNRFVVTSPDGKKYAFRDKDFAKLAANRLDKGESIDDIIKRHDDLYKKIGSPTERTNPETGLPIMMKNGYEMELDNGTWKRTARDTRKVSTR